MHAHVPKFKNHIERLKFNMSGMEVASRATEVRLIASEAQVEDQQRIRLIRTKRSDSLLVSDQNKTSCLTTAFLENLATCLSCVACVSLLSLFCLEVSCLDVSCIIFMVACISANV
jgi:hypothetical protein